MTGLPREDTTLAVEQPLRGAASLAAPAARMRREENTGDAGVLSPRVSSLPPGSLSASGSHDNQPSPAG